MAVIVVDVYKGGVEKCYYCGATVSFLAEDVLHEKEMIRLTHGSSTMTQYDHDYIECPQCGRTIKVHDFPSALRKTEKG